VQPLHTLTIQNPVTATYSRAEVIADYRLAYRSRQASLIGRREVLTGKAKFGIFGDGKEVAQLALAKVFQPGDFRSGYYRDQTIMMALELLTVQQFFAQLYAHPSIEADPASGGRMMNGHFATRSLEIDGSWKNLTEQFNSSADVSPTASQMPRMVGLAYASKLYRYLPELQHLNYFSRSGNEIVFGTIGDASTSEGMFWETINACGVLQVPLLMSVWDDNYGISVPIEHQTTKASISKALAGFQREEGSNTGGYDIYVVKAWDYPALCETYQKAARRVREFHIPALVHVTEVTQPQGHSTSGSHERYKTPERLQWEKEHDCLTRMRQWIINQGFSTAEELDAFEAEDKKAVAQDRLAAWNAYQAEIKQEIAALDACLEKLETENSANTQIQTAIAGIRSELAKNKEPIRRDIFVSIRKALVAARSQHQSEAYINLKNWKAAQRAINRRRFSSHLYSQSAESALNVPFIAPVYSENAKIVDGREVLQACFDAALGRDPRVIAFGEDVGRLGDVNQAFAGLQEKYGVLRVSDTGIRECTIIGQGIGMAMRGLRPIAEIQYLDYIFYAQQIISDDLATLQYRTVGGQKAPLIIRTRGHRLEGIWHSGSPMGTILHAFRGIYVLTPRNMTQAAGFYNTLLQSDEPGLIIEVLNGYRLKEKMPDNIGQMTTPIGVPEIIRQGTDVTLLTYGACCRLALEAAEVLQELNISVEVIDAQSLLPFDIHHLTVKSLQKTNRLLVVDEDVPGGASAYLLQEVLENQQGYQWLDAPPRTLTAQPHRPAYASDGDYFSKPSVEDIIESAYALMTTSDPQRFPPLF
jgi:pyruvate/2-oxoglutarate/acetoin dehydrogenase E1 component/TPP-dependent pyruvate/acetoin dehydrogenase alpha subunit